MKACLPTNQCTVPENTKLLQDRIRCYRCREYDHYVSECQNAVTSDSEGYDSDNAALQIMATEIESDNIRDIDRYREDTEYLNL